MIHEMEIGPHHCLDVPPCELSCSRRAHDGIQCPYHVGLQPVLGVTAVPGSVVLGNTEPGDPAPFSHLRQHVQRRFEPSILSLSLAGKRKIKHLPTLLRWLSVRTVARLEESRPHPPPKLRHLLHQILVQRLSRRPHPLLCPPQCAAPEAAPRCDSRSSNGVPQARHIAVRKLATATVGTGLVVARLGGATLQRLPSVQGRSSGGHHCQGIRGSLEECKPIRASLVNRAGRAILAVDRETFLSLRFRQQEANPIHLETVSPSLNAGLHQPA
mmetsp:Transcript_42821/g.103176  ORF Transcript_42821/g.103176 Transcript_42821/m.103176 type:complete len:271 (+) Transcript_42821:1715-2527(+)